MVAYINAETSIIVAALTAAAALWWKIATGKKTKATIM